MQVVSEATAILGLWSTRASLVSSYKRAEDSRLEPTADVSICLRL